VPTPAAELPEAGPRTADEIRNVILISMDTVRWDAVSAYGAPLVNSPNLAAFGRENVVFENVFATMPVTLPSHASILTGKIPPAHGVLDNGRYALAAEHLTLAEVLQEHGFNTAAFVSALVMDSKYGLDQGFDTYDDAIQASSYMGEIAERRGDETTARAMAWLEQHRSERNFVFLHLFDPHAPYDAPEPFASQIKKAYQEYPDYIQDYVAEIAFTDHCVGVFLRRLKELGLYDSSLVCVVADHGESQGEHGEDTHSFFVYTSTIKVPLIIKDPGARAPQRVEEPVGISDIAPTILARLGLDFGDEVQGRDLSGLLRGQRGLYPGDPILTMSLEPRKYGGNPLLGIVVGTHHYIQTTRSELYDLSRDVYERSATNLIESEAWRAQEMADTLRALLEEATAGALGEGRIGVDDESARQLESLGYLMIDGDDQVFGFDPAAPDPKDLIAYHSRTQVALTYVYPENLTTARAACQDMIAMRRDYYLGYLLMGRALVAAGRDGEAAPYFERAEALRSP
jgi:arylsulfatase A-like enzyme